MALVAAADYQVTFRENMEPVGNWKELVRTFMEQPEIRIVKKTKKNEKEVDIKPYIYDMHVSEEGIFFSLQPEV